jgi:hypothetical protein
LGTGEVSPRILTPRLLARHAPSDRPSGKLQYFGVDAGSEILTVPTTGGTPKVLAKLPAEVDGEPWQIATDLTRVYWNDSRTNSVYSMPLGGGSIDTLTNRANASGPFDPLAIDSKNAYFIVAPYCFFGCSANGVFKVPLAGGGATELFPTRGDTPYGVAADDLDDYVYFSLFNEGVICKVQK